MYVYALYTIFQCEFNCNSDYVIWTLHFENIWYGHHQASFFSVNSAVTVIMSSRHYILKYMIWSSSSIIFKCVFSCNGDYAIQRHHFSFYKIQDKVFLINVKIKIQDKKAHLRQCHSNYLHSPTGPCALHMDCGVHAESMWSLWSLCRVHAVHAKTHCLRLGIEISLW